MSPPAAARRELHLHPRLPRHEEAALLRAAQRPDSEARDDLVRAFLPSIEGVARIYRGSRTVDRRELVQAGVVGLLRALERYDPSLATPFWAYASWWVRQSMQQLVAELTRPVVLSDRALRHLARIRQARQTHLQSHGREPTCTELATVTGLGRRQVEDLVVAERQPRALEEPISSDEGVVGTFGDLLADPRAEDAYEGVPRRVGIESLPTLLRGLTERERTIVRSRYGLDGEAHTLRELGQSLGVSAERVRQIEQGALRKLQDEAMA